MNHPRLNHNFDYASHPNYVVLGLGGGFMVPPLLANTPQNYVWRFSHQDAWSNAHIVNARQSHIIYAINIDSIIARMNPSQVEFYNPQVVGTTAWNPVRRGANPPPVMPQWDPDDDEDEDEDDEMTEDERIAEGQPGEPHPFMLDQTLTLDIINEARTRLGMADLPPQPPPMEAPALFTPPANSAKLWCITFNGAPVSTEEELVSVATPLIENPGIRLIGNPIANSLWRAQWVAAPDETLDMWQDHEPVLVACIGYTPIAQAAGAQAAIVTSPLELQEQPVGALIVRAAAGALLSGGMSNHFSFNEQGGLIINPENPPSLEQGYSMMSRIFSTEETAERLKNFSRWTQGSLIVEFERFYGDAFSMDQLCEATERTYNTLNACRNTFLRWGHRRDPALSFTHYKEVEFSTLEEPDKEWVIAQSIRLSLTVAEQRKLQSYVRTYGSAGMAADLPADREALMGRLEVRSVNRNYLFMLQGAWYSYRGPFEHIPNGASQILNADTRQVLDREGVATAPREWVPVGVEVPYLRGHAATNEEGIQEAREGPPGAPVRRSRGGNTHHGAGVTGETLDVEAVQEAVQEADAVIQAPVIADLEYDDIPPLQEVLAGLHPRARRGVAEAPPPQPWETLEEYHHRMNRGEVAATQPTTTIEQILEENAERIIPDLVAGDPEEIQTERFPMTDMSARDYDQTFFNEAGAMSLVTGTGYPMGMPPHLQEMLDAARMEHFANENGTNPRTEVAFEAFMQTSDDYLAPF